MVEPSVANGVKTFITGFEMPLIAGWLMIVMMMIIIIIILIIKNNNDDDED